MDEETRAVYDARAGEYAKVLGGSLEPDAQLQSFLDALPAKADVLDLGCGPGRSAAIMARAGHRVIATDASAEMIRLAAQHDGVHAQQASFDDLTSSAIYDGIWANFSLLHAPRADLPRHMCAISEALRPKGIFHIGMKTGTGEARDELGRLYTYVTMKETHGLLKEAGLQAFVEWQNRGPGLTGKEEDFMIIQARKNG